MKFTFEIDEDLQRTFKSYLDREGKKMGPYLTDFIARTVAGLEKPGKKQPWKPFLEKLIKEGVHTRAEILKQVSTHFRGVTIATVATFLSDAANSKYRKFDREVIEVSRDCLAFGGLWEGQSGQSLDAIQPVPSP